jgi:hypothetical protein
LLRWSKIVKTGHVAIAVESATLAHEWRSHVPFCGQIVEGQLFVTLDSTCGDKCPGAEVDATVGSAGVIEIAPELAVWPQVRMGIHLNGVCIRTMREGTGE